jgi:hypothetical protein
LKHVDVNGVDDSGCTALHLAAFHGRADMISFLLSGGYGGDDIDTTVINNLGYTAYEWACKWQQLAVMEVFEQHQTESTVRTMTTVRNTGNSGMPMMGLASTLTHTGSMGTGVGMGMGMGTGMKSGRKPEARSRGGGGSSRHLPLPNAPSFDDVDGTCDSVFLGPDQWQMLKAL